MLVINVFYKLKPGKRDAFLDKIKAEGVDTGSLAEDGNSAYYYYKSVADENELFLYEQWRDVEAHGVHRTQPHYLRLQDFQWDYIEDITVHKYLTDEIK